VFGATGQQGGAVLDALLDRGAAVRAIVRDRNSVRAQTLSARSVSVVSAGHDDVVAITTALLDVGGVFLMTTYDDASGGTEGEIRRGQAMAEAAGCAGVPQVVYSSVGVCRNIFIPV
jgi:uncharacterized protein YbjT (DUF2867 family)